MLYIVRISQRLHKPILFTAAIWLCLLGSWKTALLSAVIAFFSTEIMVALSLAPVVLAAVYVLGHVKYLPTWKHFVVIACTLVYILAMIAGWGYCVFKFLLIPENFSVPSVLMGYVIATKAWVSLSAQNQELITELNLPCFAIFSQVAFISSLVSIFMLDKIEGPILLSYLLTGAVALAVLLVQSPEEETTEVEYITDVEEFMNKFRR